MKEHIMYQSNDLREQRLIATIFQNIPLSKKSFTYRIRKSCIALGVYKPAVIPMSSPYRTKRLCPTSIDWDIFREVWFSCRMIPLEDLLSELSDILCLEEAVLLLMTMRYNPADTLRDHGIVPCLSPTRPTPLAVLRRLKYFITALQFKGDHLTASLLHQLIGKSWEEAYEACRPEGRSRIKKSRVEWYASVLILRLYLCYAPKASLQDITEMTNLSRREAAHALKLYEWAHRDINPTAALHDIATILK